MKLSRKMILVPEEEYLQLTQTNSVGEKPAEKCAKIDESTENLTKMKQSGKKCTKTEQPRQKSTKIGALIENSTQTESALDKNPIQTKWGFGKRTKIDQMHKRRTKFTQQPEKCTKFTRLPEKCTKPTQLQKNLQKPLSQLNRGVPLASHLYTLVGYPFK